MSAISPSTLPTLKGSLGGSMSSQCGFIVLFHYLSGVSGGKKHQRAPFALNVENLLQLSPEPHSSCCKKNNPIKSIAAKIHHTSTESFSSFFSTVEVIFTP